MPKVAFKTLGCRLNQAETDKMAEDLISAGFEVVPESEAPDIVIVNTCTVTQEATRASRATARNMVKALPEASVVVAGCYAVAEQEEASSIEGIEPVISNNEKEEIARILSRRFPSTGFAPPLLQIGRSPGPSPGVERTRVNLKVQTGCDEFCSFCIIPYTRGPLRSYPLQQLLDEARRKVDDGARELVLTGVHLGKYGWDEGSPDDALVALLEGLLAIPDLARIRLSSILSKHLTERVVGLIRDEPRLCRFLHIPLQSGDDTVLERMNRPYRIGDYLETVTSIKEQVPEIGITTDIIVGFPAETPEQFDRTVEVVREVEYLRLHVFRYSPRPKTPSASWNDQVEPSEKKRRSKELIELGNQLRERFHRAQIGRSREILVEEVLGDGRLSGHTDNFVRVRFEAAAPAGQPDPVGPVGPLGTEGLVGGLARVFIEEASVESVRGSIVDRVAWDAADPRDVSSN